MPVPVIDNTQSVPGYLQWQAFEFQPAATNTPTSWTAVGLPSGVSINGSTGKVSGAATKPGVYAVTLRAINGSGTSTPVTFYFGIEASSPTNGLDVDLSIDLITREVRLGRPTALAAAPAPGPLLGFVGADGKVDKTRALFVAKLEDDLIIRARWEKGGVTVDMDLNPISITVKEYDTEAVILENSDVDFIRDGTGGDTGYRIYVKLTGDALASALGNYDNDASTQFPALVEIEWVAANPDTETFGPATIRGAATFLMIITRNQKID